MADPDVRSAGELCPAVSIPGQLTQPSECLGEVDVLLVGGSGSAIVPGAGDSVRAGKGGDVFERLVGCRADQREARSAEDFPHLVALRGRGDELTRCRGKRHGHDQLTVASHGE
jgi:hypothetical protein